MFTCYEPDNLHRLEYLIRSHDTGGVVMLMTDNYQKSVLTFDKVKDILGDDANSNYSELRIKYRDTQFAFGIVRSEEYKDHYRYSGCEWKALYLDTSAKFSTECFVYLTTRVRG